MLNMSNILTRVKSHSILTLNTFEILGGTLLKSGLIFGIVSIGPKTCFNSVENYFSRLSLCFLEGQNFSGSGLKLSVTPSLVLSRPNFL